MHAVAIRSDFFGIPRNFVELGFSVDSKVSVSIGKAYEIHAIAVYKRVLFIQLLDDLNMIKWLPGWLFNISDTSIPSDWIFNVFTGDIQLVCGPDFVAGSEDFYRKMLELETESVTKFWSRIDSKPMEPPSEKVG